MRAIAFAAVFLAALAAAAPAAAKPHLTRADRHAINATLDVFVNHAVKRHDPGGAYDVVTQSMRGGMTRAQWSRGDIPVYPYPAAGQRFHGWTIQYLTKDELAIELILSPTARHKAKLGQILFHVYLHPDHGRWLVDSFMPGATFAPIGKPGVVQAAADFQANPSAQSYNRSSKEKGNLPTRVNGDFIFIPFAAVGLLLAGLAGWGILSAVRSRRIAASYARPLSIPADDTRARPRHRP